MALEDLKDQIRSLPLESGVYLMKDHHGRVIYVGKAVSLRKRVRSYLRMRGHRDKTARLIEDVTGLDVLPTHSEAEALLLEASLIKQYKPKYNVELRDDKSYPFIEITGERFPRVSIVRPRRKNSRSVYYGPYVNVGLVREALTLIRKIFPFRTCDPFPKKACLDYHLGLCQAPCENKISVAAYKKNLRRVRWILEGKKDTLYKQLQKEMQALAQVKAFEKAAEVRDQLRAIGALYSGTRDINTFKEAEQLQRALGLPRLPQRIEAFDVSNILGQQAVGSMVSFLNGRPDKRHYRRFRIKHVQGIDDFEMIAEIVRRRYSRLKREGQIYPDLIVIDGGKGQLNAAYRTLQALEVDVPLISLAKRQEEVFLPNRRNPVVLSRQSLGLQLLQRLRDEAHRFAVSYHRFLRSKPIASRS